MASFLHQLKVLLWKNWLSVYRQPVWSVVLIFWPVIIFFIMAMTRIKFPHVQVSDCYLAPRNLQSTGMIPFLQSFLCETDVKCMNTSYAPDTVITRSRLKKRSVDPGGGGSTFQMRSSSDQLGTLWHSTAGDNWTIALEVINLGKTIVQDLSSGDVKGALCSSTTLFPATQLSTFQNFCNTNQTVGSFALQAVFSQASNMSSTEIVLAVKNISTYIQAVQSNSVLWNFLLMLPEWIKNPQSFTHPGEFVLNFTTVPQEISYLQTCMNYMLTTANQIQNISSISNLIGILETLSEQSLNSEMQSCISLFQLVPYGSGQSWLQMEQTYKIIYFLVTSLSNGTSSNSCEFNGLSMACNGSISWDIFLQSSLAILKEVSVDPPGALIRVVQRAWKILKQNMVEKMILQKLEQEITSNYPSNPQLQRVLTQLVHLLLNTTDILITESSMDQYFGVLQTLLDQMNMLVPPELLNMQSVNSTDLISNLTQSIVKVVQYWIDMSGLLSSSNVSSQILVDLQILIKSLSTLNSEIATFNDTAILLKILSSFNQPAFRELQKTLETLLSLNPVTSDITTTLTHAFNLFSEVMSTSSLTNSSVLADFYLKQILNFVNTDTTLQNNLAFLNSYFNYTQLAFLQSDALSSYAANIVFFFTPSNLQTMSSNPNNVSLELLKLISNFIPAKEQEIFHKVETVFMTLLDSVSTCQMEFSNCTGSIFIFQQQLSDVIQFITSLNAGTIQQIIESNSALQFVTPSNAEIAVVNNMFLMILCSRAHDNSSCNTAQDIYKNTLGQLNLIANITLGGDTNILSILPLLEQIKQDFNNVLQVLGSVDLTKLTSQLDNITSLSNCYRNTLVNPLQCTMELSSSLMDLLQMLPFPQPTNDILLVVSSIAKNWLGEINGTANVYQQLTYLYNLLNVAFHNQSTLQKINTNLFYIVQSLEELRANVNLSSIATGKLIGDLLDTFKFANINYAFPTTLLSQTNQELENIKTQLQTVQWYVLYVKNETKTFQTSGNIDSFVTMAKLIIGNVLSTVRSNPSLAPIAYDAEYVINWLEKSRIIPILQSILNDTLQGGVQSMDAFINHTVSIIEMIIQQEFVNGTVWNPLFNEIPDSDITFMLKLLQQYDGETLANLSSVLVLTENFLLTVDNLVKDFHPETAFNYNLQTIYNISQEVMSILYNAEQKSSMNKSVLYDIYNLFLENWNGNIFHELPLLKEKLMELLHLSIQCLSESMTPSLKHNCSSTDIIQMVQLILNDLGCQVSLDLPITDGNMTLNCIMEYALNSTWHINMTECAIKNDNIKEELACLAKALEITVHLISRTTNNLLDQNTTWVPEMDKALSLVTDKLSTNNFECVAIDRQIVYMMYQVFENQSSPLQPLISLFLNQTLYSTDLSQYPVYLVQVSNLVKLYISTQEHLLLNDTVFKLWNDTMLQLFEITQFRTNSSKLLVASEILKTVRNLSSYLGTVEESTEFFHMLNILNRVMNLTSATLSVNPSLPHVSLANIFYGNFSTIVVKLIQQVSSELNIKSVESCENSLHDLLTLYQSSMNLSFSGIFYSNMSSWACSLLSNNSGFDWLEELKAITSMIISLEAGAQVDSTMKIPSSFIQFVNYTRMDTFENLVTSIIGILNEKDPQMNFILFQTFHELVNYLQSIVKEVLSSGNISPVFTAENVIINTMGAVNIILKNLNITCYEEIFTLTSEVFQIYFNMTNSTLPMESLAQKILVHIWTSFQKSGLENVVVQSLQSQILSQSSEKQKILQNFLNIVISAINETASESALESPSYTKKLIFNIIENIVEQLNSTELLESLCGNKDITELIVSLVNGIQQSAKNWNNVSQVMTFPQNGTNQAVNALENLLNSWISENTGKKELYFNYSTNTINIFYLFFSQAEKAHVMQILHYFLDFNNGTINVPVLLSTLENMYDLFNLNNTNSVNVLELYIKQLLNFIADSQINQTLSELSFLLNTSQKLSFFQTGELREAALELLTFFDPPSLYNITKDSSNLVSMLLNLLTMNISHEELQSFNNITDAIVSLLQLVNNCSKVSESCVSAVSGFEMLVVDVVNAIASTGNGTLYLEISNETVQEFEKLTNAQISLINIIFSMLWNAQKHIHNYSGDFPNVYQEVLSASKLILNLTRELNTNTAQSDFEMLKNYSQQISIIQKIISTNKITEFLLQIINIHRQSQCTNQTLLCTFNLTSHLLSFLGKLQVSNPVMERILVVSSIVEYWMGEINTTADIYQQMVSLYGLTKAALQNEPGLHTIQATLTDISQIIQNIKVDNTSFSAMEELILTFVKLLQPDNNVILPNNAMYINSAQLQDVKAQIQIIQWYIMYIKNQTENYNMSSDIYAFYRLAQFSLTNMMPSIQDWFINVGHSYNVTEFLTLVNLSSHEIDTLFQLLQQLLTTNQTNLGAMSQLENWIQLLEISKQINTVQGLNTSEFTTIWQVIKNIMAGDLSITQIDEILKAVQTAITMQNITVGTDITQLYDLFLGILNQTHSTGNMNLTQILHFSVDSFLTMDCQGVFKILTAVYKMIKNTNPSSSWPDDMFFSNLTMDICGLLHWNYSQNDSVSLLQTSRGIILYVAPLVPDSMRKYFSAAEYILELAVQLIADPAITQNNIVTIMNIVPVINGLLNNKSSSTDWVESKIFQKLIYFLLDFVWTSSSPKEVLLLKGQNFILTMVQDIQDMLKAQPGYPYNAWLSFALDMVETFINRTQNTSSEDRFLKDVWDSFKQNGLESVIISTVGQLVSNNGSTSNETANTLELLLRLVFNFTDLIISEIPLSALNVGKDTTIKILQLALSDFFQILLPQNKNTTPVLVEDLQSVMNVTRIFSQLEMLINSFTTVNIQANISNNPDHLFNLLSALNQTGLISDITTFIQGLITSDNMQYSKLFLDALKMFQDFVQINNTINIQDLSAIITKYLPVYLEISNETQSSLNAILNLWQYLNNMTGAHSSHLSNTLVHILPFFQSHILLNESIDVSNLTSWLVNLISGYIPSAERETFEKATNASLLLIESMQSCTVKPQTCTDLIEGIQNFVSDVIQLESGIQNRTVANSSLLQFVSYNQSEITLLNDIVLVLSYAMGHPYNSTNQTGVYEDFLTLKNWFLNTTMEDNVNVTAPASLQNLVEVLTSVNITQFLLQIENMLHTSTCTSQADIHPLFCKLNVMFQFTQLLNLLPLEQTTNSNLSIISSVAGQWLSQINSNISIYQQLIDLYNVTVLAIQYQPTLQAINISLVNIVHILQNLGVLQNVNLNGSDIAIHLLSEMIQKVESETNMYNLSSVLQYNISELLETIQLQLDTVNWLMLQVEKKPGMFNSSLKVNTVAQWMIDNYQHISLIIRDVEFMINSFNHVFNLTDLLHIFNVAIQNEQIQALIHQIEAEIFTKASSHLLMNENIQKDAEIALFLLQEINRVNTSLILTSINQVYQTIQGIKGLDLGNPFYNKIIAGKVLPILNKGMGILYDIQVKGTIGKEALYQIYNFTYLLVQDEWNWVPFQNISSMEAELLDVFYLAMTPFLGGNGSQAYIGNCSAQDVLQILVQTISRNATGNEPLVKTTCNWQLVSNSSDSSPSSNHTLDDMIYLALQSSPVFHNVCNKDSLHPLAEEMACLMQVMRISIGVLADLNNMSGLQMPLIQTLNNSLTFMCNNMPDHNSTFQSETQLLTFLDAMFFNQSNPIHMVIQFLIKHYNSTMQTSDLQQIRTEISRIVKVLAPVNGSFDNHICELIEAVVNFTIQPNWFESWQAFDNVLSMNWTFTNVDVSLSVLERLRRAFVLINSGMDAKTLQIYQAIVSLLKNPNFTALLDMTNPPLMNATLFPVAECTAALNAVATFSDSLWAAFDPTHSNLEEELLVNFTVLACEVLHFQSWNYTWMSNLETIKHILPYLVHYIPAEITHYFIALEKIISFLSDILRSPNISQENIVGGVYELFIQELMIFSNTTIITDWIEKIPIRNFISILFSLNSNVTTEQVIILEKDVLYLLSRILNATSYSQGYSMLSDLITYLPDNTSSLTTVNGIIQQLTNLMTKFIVTVQIPPLTEPYGTLMNCVKNVTEDLSGHLSGHLEVAIQLAQDLFTLSNESANTSMIPDLLKQKIYQLQNLTTLVCGLDGSSNSQSFCYLPCQYLTLLQNVTDLVTAGIKVTQTATSMNSPVIITSVLGSISQSIENEISTKLSSIFPINDLTNITAQLSMYINETKVDFQGLLTWPSCTSSEIQQQDIKPPTLYFLLPMLGNMTYHWECRVLLQIPQGYAGRPVEAILGNIFHNSSHVEEQLSQVVKLNQTSITALMSVPIPNDTIQIGAWFTTLNQCNTNHSLVAEPLQVFCNLSPEQGYQMAIIFLQNVDILKLMYRLLVPSTWQASLDMILTALKSLIEKLEGFLQEMPSEQEFTDTLKIMKKLLGLSTKSTRKRRSVDPSVSSGSTRANTASLTDITKRMCSGNYRGLSQALYSLYPMTKSSTNRNSESAQNLSTLYGIPTDNSFCLNLFTDLVETSSGAAYWILLKPLLYGQILYTPNTPETQKIMQKTSNSLLQMENYKAIINNASTNMQKILDNWPFLQVAQNLIGVLESILNNTVISSILEEFLKINTTDLSVKLNAADNFIEKLGSNIDLITVFQNICEVLVNLMSCMSYIRIQPMNSPADMSAKAEQLQKTNELFAAVTFHLPSGTSRQKRSVSETSGLPKQIKYTISMRSLLSENTNSIRDSNWIPEPHNTVNKYSRGFVYLQENIERAIIEMQTNKTLDNVGVQYQPMPFPCHKKDSFLYSMSFSLPIALMITWVLFIAAFVKKLVHEKELRLHEYMKMMGINSCSHFFAWFIESACFLIITVSILVLILKFGKILSLSNGFILFLFFLDYSLTVIAMSYLISVFFHNTNVAALSGSLIYIITFFPFIVVVSKEASLSFAGKTLLSLFSPTALSYATQYLVHFEEQGEGIQWHNIYNSTVKNDTFNFGWLCWLMLIDAMIYFVVGWYIRIVFPGKYGIGTPWYFPVLPSFWRECCGFQTLCSRKPSGLMISNIVSHGMPEKKGDDLYPHHEQEPTDLNVGVSLHGLTKVYKSKSAVQNLNLNFYEGHITSLLGHNGAGKTTTLSMLTGLFSATSGTIYVYGEDIRTRLDQARKNMGVCMQYDVLFDHLTTKEHLLLYGSIKAPQWNQRQLHEEVKSTLKETGLYSHRHKPVKTLSGGMRRKLSICIALIGGSRVVILDEPTTGVDPCSRRSIWEVISKNKKDKTIILSTHHLDEAEVLSDRIAFLEQGGLRCCGTPMFLKEKFGSGYHLTLTKKFPNQNDDKQCDSEAVTSLIQSHIPEATLKEDVGGELVYVLPPFRAEISNAYLSLLRDLDTNMNDLYIGCYGISDTTIEEVFLKLTDGLDEDDQELSNRAIPIPSQDLIVDDESSSNSYSFFDRDDQQLTKMENVRGVKLLLKKIMAILIKRFHNSKRNWKGLISQILLPVLFVIAAMGLGSLSMSSVDYPELLLTPGLYGTTDQAVVFRISNKSSEDLMNAMSSFPGIDDSCLNQNSQCLPENSLGSWNPTADQTFAYDNCSCSVGYEVCAALDASPPHRMTYSRQMMYNLTGKNMENYLLATTLQFVQTRYGGWSFGVPASQLNSFVPVSDNLTLNKVWYNNEGPHSLPAFLNSFSNFLLRANLPSNESAQYSISVYNKPLPGAVTQPTITMALVNTLVALSVLVGYSITTASFVTYVVKEHDNGSKRLQHIAGVGEVCYWVTNFLYDLAIYFIPVALSIAMVAAFKLPAFSNYPNLGGVSILFILFGYATFSWMYLIAGTFKNAGMAFITYVCINLFIGINTIISSSVVYMLTQQKSTTDQDFESLNTTYNALINVFKIFPQFCFGYGLIQLSQQQAMQDQLAIYGNYDKVDIFKMDILGYMFLAMAVQGTFCFALRLLINDGIIYSVKTFFKKIFKMYPNLLVKNPEEDEDVTAESERVVSGNANDDLLVLQGLTKIFHQVNKNVIAVHNMSLGIPPGECFGLLGVNGAGKTTTFKMLTGDISPSAGNIQVRNHTGNLMNVLGFNTDWSSFGYCPQEDALDELMTGEEHLYYYARIHGIPERRIKSVTNQLLQKLQLVQYKDRITANYSCGTRRKLSTALALIGKPSILLLDEPSSGMDPKTKRHLWKIISEEIQENCAVVLTSHSMEECEALCTRLAIMVKGKFQCIGSLQHIKSRFGSGFTVKMHLKDSSVSVETITGFMHLQFPNTYLKEQHFTMVEYHVPVSAGGVATIFDLLESNKIALNIIHFSVSQTTLDEVFINFAQAQASLDNSSASSQEFQQVVMA